MATSIPKMHGNLELMTAFMMRHRPGDGVSIMAIAYNHKRAYFNTVRIENMYNDHESGRVVIVETHIAAYADALISILELELLGVTITTSVNHLIS